METRKIREQVAKETRRTKQTSKAVSGREKRIQLLFKSGIIDEETGYLNARYFSEETVQMDRASRKPLRR